MDICTPVEEVNAYAMIRTYSGKMFSHINPQPEDIDIKDIAHALSLQCRFSGHTKFHYSVAQHSLYTALWVQNDENRLWGLLHDASEAYLVDLPRPVKHNTGLGVRYKEAELRIMKVICEKFGLDPVEPPEVKEVDRRLLETEGMQLMDVMYGMAEPIEMTIREWSPRKAEELFLETFQHYK